MKSNQKLWSREEILIAINLYHKLTFGQLDRRNKKIIEIAESLHRTPSSLALKLSNLASLDSSIPQRGMANYSKLDKEIWDEFYLNPEEMVFESENLINGVLKEESDWEDVINRKTETKRETITRVNQGFFRKSILASYEHRCCISGLNLSSLLIASHIVPWNADIKNRLNPCNGLLLNALYDKAFDKGFFTISKKYEILISGRLMKLKPSPYLNDNFISLNKKQIELPNKFLPKQEFIEYHNDQIFLK